MSELGGACPQCGSPCDSRSLRCKRCMLSQGPKTPLRDWRVRSNRSFQWLARATGLSLRTVRRVAVGGAATTRVAKLIHRYTGISYTDLLEGAP